MGTPRLPPPLPPEPQARSGSTWRWCEGLLDLLLPAACVLCRRPHAPARLRSVHREEDSIVCPACLIRLVPLTLPLCDRCGHPRLSPFLPQPLPRPDSTGPILPSALDLPPCRWCPRLDPAIRAVRSVCRMDEGTGGEIVHALKYQGWHRVARPMACRMARLSWPRDVEEERAALIPIPLSPERLRERGYNQAEALARALAPRWSIPLWHDTLRRTRHTASQVRLTPLERTSNVSEAFAVPNHRRAMLRGQHVVLVDDVVTTGATLNAAAQALLEGGARIISCVTFGRAPDSGDRTASDDDSLRN